MLSISHESEGYDKGNIVIKDVAVTMGMLCAPRLSLKPLIHDSRSYVDVLLFHMRTPSCAVSCFASWLVSQLVITPDHFILCRDDVELLPVLSFL